MPILWTTMKPFSVNWYLSSPNQYSATIFSPHPHLTSPTPRARRVTTTTTPRSASCGSASCGSLVRNATSFGMACIHDRLPAPGAAELRTDDALGTKLGQLGRGCSGLLCSRSRAAPMAMHSPWATLAISSLVSAHVSSSTSAAPGGKCYQEELARARGELWTFRARVDSSPTETLPTP